jgi:hypothetical protein
MDGGRAGFPEGVDATASHPGLRCPPPRPLCVFYGATMNASVQRVCGSCSLCCKLPYVPELNKPIDTWCPHCRPGHGGCTIYSSRPSHCEQFTCLWLDGRADDHWFPARCKMVLTRRKEDQLLVTVDPSFPNAWRQEPYYATLRRYANRGIFVGVRIGRRCIDLGADGSEKEVYQSQALIEGRSEDKT